MIYLRVKLRKERTLARSEFTDVESRIVSVRTRAINVGNVSTAPAPAPPAGGPAPGAVGARRAGARGVKGGQVWIVRGHTQARKVVEVEGMDAADVLGRLTG